MPPRTYATTPGGMALQYDRLLGTGQFGVAHAVRSRKGSTYCLKEIPVKMADDEAMQEALVEVSMMKETCTHDNIVTFYDSWFHNNRLLILMEYAPNGSLDRLLERCARSRTFLTCIKVAHFVEELAGALDYCHNTLKIMHRDIKPGNILIDELGSLKLSDFGLSKSVGPTNDIAMTFCGSPLYMAPEQLRSNRQYSFPADMWAMGCVVYEIMGLTSPWRRSDCFATHVIRITSSTPDYAPLVARYPKRLLDTTQWMLQRDVAKRATAAQIVSLLEMRSPPVALVDPPPPSSSANVEAPPPEPPPPATLDATLFEAATAIQRSFRLLRHSRVETKAALPDDEAMIMVHANRLVLFDRPTGAAIRPKREEALKEKTAALKEKTAVLKEKTAVLQRAMRASVTRRRTRRAQTSHTPDPPPHQPPRGRVRTTATQPSAPEPVRCTPRLEALAQPRTVRPALLLPNVRARPFRAGSTPQGVARV